MHFPSADGAASATTALHRLFAERLGDNAVSISRYACEPDYLYVQRGAHYAYNDSKRRRGAKLPGEEDQEF